MDAFIDKNELRDSARHLLERYIDRQAYLSHDVSSAVPDRKLWQLIAELGWLGLTVDEDKGGLGQPFAVLSVLYIELGRALSAQPFASAMIGLEAASHAQATIAAASVVASAIVGDAIVVPVIGSDSLRLSQQAGGNVRLDGRIRNVLDAPHATHLLVPLDGEEAAVALLALPYPGVVVSHRPTWDRTRQIADIEFNGVVPGENDVILRGEAAQQAMARLRAHFDLALACDAWGGAAAAFEQTLEYMNQRHQFNRPIASFQALKHRCADLKASLEATRALLEVTCRDAGEKHAGWEIKAASARLYVGAVYKTVTDECVQLHGGIGFTWEYTCHLFLKRARLSEVLGGAAEKRKDRLAPQLFKLATQAQYPGQHPSDIL